jgi:phosphotransferase system enzyme I (PtsI)
MFPMISTIEELRRARVLLEQAKAELEAEGTAFDRTIKSGVMIEVPSAALQAHQIARETDFLSIGTNDLIQYTLAVDRDNSAVSPLYQQFHPAVLRVIKMTIDAAHDAKIWAGMCGEMAGDPLATILLVGLGLDEFSVIPSLLPEIKKIIRSVDIGAAREVAERAMALPTAGEIREYLTGVMRELMPDIPLDT